MSEPHQDRTGRLLFAVCGGLVACVMTMWLGGPALHYVPGEALWTWHRPEGVVVVSYFGLLLNAALGWAVGWGLGGVGPVRRRIGTPVGARRVAWVAATVVCVTLTMMVAHEVTRDRTEHTLASKRLGVGDSLPAFSLQTAEETTVGRDDLLGKGPVVLYFYPRDETTGCTAQACLFRDRYEVFTDAGAEVVGVSSDTVQSHRAFADNHQLPFMLLADPRKVLRRAFGVPRTLGIVQGRVTYVLDREGIIRHVFDSQIRVEQHVREALETVQRLTAK